MTSTLVAQGAAELGSAVPIDYLRIGDHGGASAQAFGMLVARLAGPARRLTCDPVTSRFAGSSPIL